MTNIVDMLMHFLFLVLGIVEKVVEKAGNAGVLEKVIDKAEKVIASSNEKKESDNLHPLLRRPIAKVPRNITKCQTPSLLFKMKSPLRKLCPKLFKILMKPKRQNQIAPRIAYKMSRQKWRLR